MSALAKTNNRPSVLAVVVLGQNQAVCLQVTRVVQLARAARKLHWRHVNGLVGILHSEQHPGE